MKRKIGAAELALAYELLASGATAKQAAWGLGIADYRYLCRLIRRCENEGLAWLTR